MFKEIINVAKAFGSAEGMANTVHIPFPPEGAQESRTVKPKKHRVSAAEEGGIKKAEQIADALLVNERSFSNENRRTISGLLAGTIGRIFQVLSERRRLSRGSTQTPTNKDAAPKTKASHVDCTTPGAPGALEGQRRGSRRPPGAV